MTEVRFLGRVVSAEGYRMAESNVSSVKNLLNQAPKTVGDVRKCLDYCRIIVVASHPSHKEQSHCMIYLSYQRVVIPK